METAIQDYKFFHAITQLPFVDAVILFGSRARGDHQPRSDIDLAICCPQATRDEWLQIKHITEEPDTLLEIDCVRLEDLSEQNSLRRAISEEGKLLFERNEHKHA